MLCSFLWKQTWLTSCVKNISDATQVRALGWCSTDCKTNPLNLLLSSARACSQLVLLCITLRKMGDDRRDPKEQKDRAEVLKIRPSREVPKTEGQSGENWAKGNPNKFLNLEKATMGRNRVFYSPYPYWVGLGAMALHFKKELEWRWLKQELESPSKKIFKNSVDKLLSGITKGNLILALGRRGFLQMYLACPYGCVDLEGVCDA